MVIFDTKTIYMDVDVMTGQSLCRRMERVLKSDKRFDGVAFEYQYAEEQDCAKFVLTGGEEQLEVLVALLEEPVTDRERRDRSKCALRRRLFPSCSGMPGASRRRLRRCAALVGAVCALTASCLLVFSKKE